MTRIPGPKVDFTDVAASVVSSTYMLSSTARKDLTNHFGTFNQASKAAHTIFTKLTSGDYDHSVHLPNPPADCDVYGLTTVETTSTPPPSTQPPHDTNTNADVVDWYIKFYEDVSHNPPYNFMLQVVSFHVERQTPRLKAKRRVTYP